MTLPDAFSRAFSLIFAVSLKGHNKIIWNKNKNDERGISKLR